MSEAVNMYMRNGSIFTVIAVESKGGGHYQMSFSHPGMPQADTSEQVRGKAEIRAKLISMAENGFIPCDESGKAVYNQRLSYSDTATIAEAAAAEIGLQALIDAYFPENLSLGRMVQIVSSYLKSRQNFLEEGSVNAKWANGRPALNRPVADALGLV